MNLYTKKIFAAFTTIAVLSLLLVGANIYFHFFYQTDAIRYEPSVIQRPVLHPNQTFSLTISRCADETYPVTVSTFLITDVTDNNTVSGEKLTLVDNFKTEVPKGCRTFVGIEHLIPERIELGQYHIRSEVVYTVKWFIFTKTNVTTFESNDFLIANE